jgi:hypothetical protein
VHHPLRVSLSRAFDLVVIAESPAVILKETSRRNGAESLDIAGAGALHIGKVYTMRAIGAPKAAEAAWEGSAVGVIFRSHVDEKARGGWKPAQVKQWISRS